MRLGLCMPSHPQIVECVFNKPWLKMRRLLHEPACSDNLVDNEPWLIGRQFKPLFHRDLVHDEVHHSTGRRQSLPLAFLLKYPGVDLNTWTGYLNLIR